MDLSELETLLNYLGEAFGEADGADDDGTRVTHLRYVADIAESVLNEARSLIESAE